MKNIGNSKNAYRYLQEVLMLIAKTTAFGIVGFIRYEQESTDTAGILYDLTESGK